MWLVAGLGNPGEQYEGTRHNIGFLVEAELRARAGAPEPRARWGGELSEGTLGGQRALFLRPLEFMNLSGQAVGRAMQFYKLPPDNVLVLHDDVDLPFGRLRLGQGGGHGGHNGLRSIIGQIGAAFLRVRIGVGRPPEGMETADYVLGKWKPPERQELPALITHAADAADQILRDGLTVAMNAYNRLKDPP